MIKTVIFDWDGTLHNTVYLYNRSLNRACQWLADNGYQQKVPLSIEESSRYLGMNSVEMWKTFRPDLSPELREKCSGIVGDAMVEEILGDGALLFPGALEMLQKLKEDGYKLVYLSNCRSLHMEVQQKRFHTDEIFDAMFCSGNFNFMPKPEIFARYIAPAFPGEYCMVGDRAPDIDVAVVNGIHSIGCAYGFCKSDELSQAEILANDVTEIPALLKQLDAKKSGNH